MKKFTVNYGPEHQLRFQKSLHFLEKHIPKPNPILDLGPLNPLSELMTGQGWTVENTRSGQDLDLDFEQVKNADFSVLTAFEILEHLVSPFPLLNESRQQKLIASVPLKLWFAEAYWSKTDPFDRHYHEFEVKQFQMLLEKAGWHIRDEEKLIVPSRKLGIRPILRNFFPRIYLVYAERIS